MPEQINSPLIIGPCCRLLFRAHLSSHPRLWLISFCGHRFPPCRYPSPPCSLLSASFPAHSFSAYCRFPAGRLIPKSSLAGWRFLATPGQLALSSSPPNYEEGTCSCEFTISSWLPTPSSWGWASAVPPHASSWPRGPSAGLPYTEASGIPHWCIWAEWLISKSSSSGSPWCSAVDPPRPLCFCCSCTFIQSAFSICGWRSPGLSGNWSLSSLLCQSKSYKRFWGKLPHLRSGRFRGDPERPQGSS